MGDQLQGADGQRASLAPVGLLGIDVYSGDGPIKWAALPATGRYYAWLKATEGGDFVDKLFATSRQAAQEAKFINGAYHFYRPKTGVQLQINNFCNTVGALRSGDLRPALDLEVPEQWKGIAGLREAHMAEWHAMAMEDRMSRVLQWLEAVEARLQMRPCIYASPSFIEDILGSDQRLLKYPLWLAHYNTDTPRIPKPWSRYTWHQYSEHGSIPEATSHELDLNRFDGTLEGLSAHRFGAGVQAEEHSQETPAAQTAWYYRCPFTRWWIELFRDGV